MTLEFIDSHAHLDFDDFHGDFDAVLERAENAGVAKILNIGADLERSQSSIYLAEHHSNIWATVGVHPDEAKDIDAVYVREELEKMVKSSRRVVGIGECGIDYFRTNNKHEMAKQVELFKVHLEIAREHHLPLVIHIRNGNDDQAYRDALATIREVEYFNGVVHCFTFGPEEAREIMDMGFYIGFTGIVTYKNAQNVHEAVKFLPLEKILIETDAPLLAPQMYRGGRNEPAFVVEVAKRIAEIKNLPIEEVALQTTKNVVNLFHI